MNGGAGWAREPDGRFGENCLAPVGIRNPDYPARRLVAVPTTLSPPQMMDTNNKYEDQIHWILDESSKNKATHSERKERIDTSQFRNFHTNTEEIQILLAGKTGEPTAAAPALLLPITAFSHYKTRSINAECLTFKADCRIPFFFFFSSRVPLHASCNLGANCTETVLASPGRRWTNHAPSSRLPTHNQRHHSDYLSWHTSDRPLTSVCTATVCWKRRREFYKPQTARTLLIFSICQRAMLENNHSCNHGMLDSGHWTEGDMLRLTLDSKNIWAHERKSNMENQNEWRTR